MNKHEIVKGRTLLNNIKVRSDFRMIRVKVVNNLRRKHYGETSDIWSIE